MNKKLGKRIKLARLRLNLSQAELAKKCGWIKSMTPQTRIANYELGNREPSLSSTVLLAKALDVSIEWLLGNDKK